MTPEQEARAEAEASGSDKYDDGRPKMHRHFGQFDIHRDDQCQTRPSRRRVYVFDEDSLAEHERFISERVWTEGHEAGWQDGFMLDRNAEGDNPYKDEP